ncbi:uncharacterized protein [Macrobrachium rosenbergii]|uniref:uncharacterized protein n=1 Tax=Macrobrachium rosenbergii TaxID=79674 RepID=UPI0034D3CEDF
MCNHLICLPLLQTLIRLRLEVERIRKVYKLKQGYYLREYITENAERRAKETDPDKRNTIKILMNGLFGVTIKNPLNYSTRTVVTTNETSLLRNVSKHMYKSFERLEEYRYIVNHCKETVKAESPIYIGFSILDLAKDMVYKFRYDVLQKLYGGRVKLLYTDTDSLISLETNDLTCELKDVLKPHLDLSNFPKTHTAYDSSRQGKLGLVKVETVAELIREFIGVKPKVYSYETQNSRCNTLKGIQSCRQKTISHSQYLDVIKNNEITHTTVHN